MKLGKFLKHVDFFTELEIYDEQENLIYLGGVIPFHAASDKDKGERYIKECEEEEDYQEIKNTKLALQLFNRKLYTDINGEAVGIKDVINEHGVKRYILVIYVKGVGK